MLIRLRPKKDKFLAESIRYPNLIAEIWRIKPVSILYWELERIGKLVGTFIDYMGQITQIGDTIRLNGKNVITDRSFLLFIGELSPKGVEACQTEVFLMQLVANHVASVALEVLLKKHPGQWREFALDITRVEPARKALKSPYHLRYQFVYHVKEKGK